MVRTIYVVFTNIRLSDPQVRNMKQYRFLCPYDMVQIGDMIEDDRYSQRMQVVGCTQCVNDVQDGIILKTIQPSKINGIKVICDWSINNKQIGNMEARNISVTLEQAREWYNSGNSTLRTLALNAYKESELMGYDYIKQLVKREATSVIVPEGEVKKINVYSRLAIVAKYFNGSWEMKAGKTGYFIGKSSMGGSAVVQQVNLTDGIAIYEHRTVQYAGIVYFKNAQDAKEAAKLLFDELNLLF